MLEESATGEKMTSWTVYSVAKLVSIQQVHTENPLINVHGRRMGPRSRWRVLSLVRDSSIVRYGKFCRKMYSKEAFGPFTSRHTGPGHGNWKRRCRMVHKLSLQVRSQFSTSERFITGKFK